MKKSGSKRKTQKDLANEYGVSDRTIREWKKTGRLAGEQAKKTAEEIQEKIQGNFYVLLESLTSGLTLKPEEFDKIDEAYKAKLSVELVGKLLNALQRGGTNNTQQTQVVINGK